MIEGEIIKSIVDKVYPMEQAADAHRRVETEQRLGAVVIAIGERSVDLPEAVQEKSISRYDRCGSNLPVAKRSSPTI
jgi:hypothetical protein